MMKPNLKVISNLIAAIAVSGCAHVSTDAPSGAHATRQSAYVSKVADLRGYALGAMLALDGNLLVISSKADDLVVRHCVDRDCSLGAPVIYSTTGIDRVSLEPVTGGDPMMVLHRRGDKGGDVELLRCKDFRCSALSSTSISAGSLSDVMVGSVDDMKSTLIGFGTDASGRHDALRVNCTRERCSPAETVMREVIDADVVRYGDRRYDVVGLSPDGKTLRVLSCDESGCKPERSAVLAYETPRLFAVEADASGNLWLVTGNYDFSGTGTTFMAVYRWSARADAAPRLVDRFPAVGASVLLTVSKQRAFVATSDFSCTAFSFASCDESGCRTGVPQRQGCMPIAATQDADGIRILTLAPSSQERPRLQLQTCIDATCDEALRGGAFDVH